MLDQLVASAGSVSANRCEALSASSRREFIRFNEIALRSARESALWLSAFTKTGIGDVERATTLLDEAQQLARILGAVVISAKRKSAAEP